ncbi:DinB family protein [Fictibacillus barbaricus]|uniref:Damage-inducible protein DinB n=1 Tax=Fictibacillus barbaricus TaxID=182136 RepID=A0ABU1U629_9BACL|nr:DinB family protein [Fictibacillus barbaricus]MDR7074933.1 putative damage-inducible protein DinB [Fictibacillus barbaricus]
MNKVIMNYQYFTNWLESLKTMPEEYWLVPIKEGKWSVGEIISHIKAWDHFVWEERVRYFVSGTELPKKNFDPEEINKKAAEQARIGNSKNKLIDDVIECRNKVAKKLEEVPASIWEIKIELGKGFVSLSEYIEGLVEHDLHHQAQIEQFLLHKGINIQN